jgi:hypothetical protein
MTENRLAGLALIAGSCGMIITMAFHPHGHVTSAELPSMIRMLILVHGLALACIPVMFLGTWGLSRRIATPSRLDVAGLVLYAFGLIAVMGAAVADGLVTPRVLEQIVASADSPSTMETWRMFSRYTFIWNQAFAQVFVVASSAAIIAWSAAVWRSRMLPLGLAIYGCILGLVTMVALFSGHLPLDVHGFGAVMLGQSIWFVIAGAVLWNSGSAVEVEG